MTVIGIDAHKRTHTLVAIDGGGRKLGQKTVSANSSGHAEAMQWATTRFGTDLTWAVEDNRSVTGLLEREFRRRVNRGEIGGYKVGHRWMMTEADVEAFIESRRKPATSPGRRRCRASGPAHLGVIKGPSDRSRRRLRGVQ